jgi:hypothetical protein
MSNPNSSEAVGFNMFQSGGYTHFNSGRGGFWRPLNQKNFISEGYTVFQGVLEIVESETTILFWERFAKFFPVTGSLRIVNYRVSGK